MSDTDRKKARGLGRGLSALMSDVALAPQPEQAAPTPARSDRNIPVEAIQPNPDQPRRHFAPEKLEDLAASIREKGILQPLIVRPRGDVAGQFEIVAGERRWRAAQIAQLHEVPVIVRELNDVEVLEVAIIENIQRADLNPVEEGLGYRQLIDRFGHTQEQLATALGKSRSHIANQMRLLQLPRDVQQLVAEGKISMGHARALITTDNASELAQKIISGDLSVRQTEKLIKSLSAPHKETSEKLVSQKDADTAALEGDLSAQLKMKVIIDHNEATGKGTLTIAYKDLDDLDDLCRLLSAN